MTLKLLRRKGDCNEGTIHGLTNVGTFTIRLTKRKMKTAIVVFSDPKAGSEEALGRVINALATAYDYKNAGRDVSIYFQGAGTRWPEELVKSDHPVHQLFKSVEGCVVGVSCLK
jgi:hypothetical protein